MIENNSVARRFVTWFRNLLLAAKFKPKEIVILYGENSIYQLNMELVGKYSQHFTDYTGDC